MLLALVPAWRMVVDPRIPPHRAGAGVRRLGRSSPAASSSSAAGVVFLGGLRTSLTPCVYPLIPITVSVFGARKGDSRAEGGAAHLRVRGGHGGGVQHPGGDRRRSPARPSARRWATPGWSPGSPLFMVVLASSMFGAFELALPSSWATRLNTVGGGGFVGALLMGSVVGLPRRALHRPGADGSAGLRRQDAEPGARRRRCSSSTRWASACPSSSSACSRCGCPRAACGWSG